MREYLSICVTTIHVILFKAFGVGAFEEDDEDIYCQEDMSQYDFSLESTSKTAKQRSSEHSVKSLPRFGESVLEGFILGKNSDTFKKYFPPPILPQGFQPKHQPKISRFQSLDNNSTALSSNKIKDSSDSKKKGPQRPNITAVERAAIIGDEILTPPSDNTNVIIKVEEDEESETVSKIPDKLTVSTGLGYSKFKPFAAYPEKEKRYEKYLELLKKGQKGKYIFILIIKIH